MASGTLLPDTYFLVFEAASLHSSASVDTFGNANYNFNLALAPIDGVPLPVIPEPTTIVLVTSGLVGMGVRQWRKRRSR